MCRGCESSWSIIYSWKLFYCAHDELLDMSIWLVFILSKETLEVLGSLFWKALAWISSFGFADIELLIYACTKGNIEYRRAFLLFSRITTVYSNRFFFVCVSPVFSILSICDMVFLKLLYCFGISIDGFHKTLLPPRRASRLICCISKESKCRTMIQAYMWDRRFGRSGLVSFIDNILIPKTAVTWRFCDIRWASTWLPKEFICSRRKWWMFVHKFTILNKWQWSWIAIKIFS